MGPASSLPHSQEPTACLYAERGYYSPCPFPGFRISVFNIILPSMPVSCKCLVSLSFPHQNRMCASRFPHTCYIPRLSHSPWFMIMYLFLSTFTFSIFFLPPDLHPTQLSVYNSKVLTRNTRTSRKLPNLNDMCSSKVNSAMWDWSRCFPNWHYHFELHLTCSAGTVVSCGTQPVGNSSSLQNELWCEWQPRACVRKHNIPHFLVLSERRCSKPQI